MSVRSPVIEGITVNAASVAVASYLATEGFGRLLHWVVEWYNRSKFSYVEKVLMPALMSSVAVMETTAIWAIIDGIANAILERAFNTPREAHGNGVKFLRVVTTISVAALLTTYIGLTPTFWVGVGVLTLNITAFRIAHFILGVDDIFYPQPQPVRGSESSPAAKVAHDGGVSISRTPLAST